MGGLATKMTTVTNSFSSIKYVSIYEVISGDMLALNEPEDDQLHLVL